MSDYAKLLVARDDWPAPNRSGFMYSMSQQERIELLDISSWPDLDWSNQWIMLTKDDAFDLQIAFDARSGLLQEAFGVDEILSDPDGYLEKMASETEYRTPLDAIECRDDGKYIQGTDASLLTWLEYEEKSQEEQFFEDYDVPKEIEEQFRV